MDDWKIRMDAETLLEADKIKGDSSRLTAAIDMTKIMAEEMTRESEALIEGMYPSMKDADDTL